MGSNAKSASRNAAISDRSELERLLRLASTLQAARPLGVAPKRMTAKRATTASAGERKKSGRQ